MDQNFHSNKPITIFIRVKTSKKDCFALEVATADHMLSIPINGVKKKNRIGSILFLGCHFFSNKRFTKTTEKYNEKNYIIGKEKNSQNYLVIYYKNTQVRHYDELTFSYSHQKSIRKTF